MTPRFVDREVHLRQACQPPVTSRPLPGSPGSVAGILFPSTGACALAGAIRTDRHGIVYFAVLNRGVPVEPARRRQDGFVRALLADLGGDPWPYRRDDSPAFTRAEVTPPLSGGVASAGAR